MLLLSKITVESCENIPTCKLFTTSRDTGATRAGCKTSTCPVLYFGVVEGSQVALCTRQRIPHLPHRLSWNLRRQKGRLEVGLRIGEEADANRIQPQQISSNNVGEQIYSLTLV